MPQIIHLVRHGQAIHNLGQANNVLPDTDLTPLGEEQARSLISKHPELANVDLIVSSPLRRTLQTTLLGFAAQLERGLQIVALPEVQEVSAMDCDTGSDLSVIKAEFQQQVMKRRLADSRVGDNLGLGACRSVLEDLVLDTAVFLRVPFVEAGCGCAAALADKGKCREDIQQSCLHVD
ncbi:hypothetical protein H9Q70_002199 [Fusarium xylarioides]|nr:hypothetical protein H9Q70_002199 [Fusarium xylarioides]